MILVTLFIFVAIFRNISTQNCPKQAITSHKVLKDGSYRLTTLQRGNFTIQGLISFTEFNNCKKVSKLGLISVYAMNYAVDKMNKNTSLIPWGSLGLQLDNVCYNLTLTMARGIEAVSLHRPNSVCRADFLKCDKSQNLSAGDVKPVTAIVGTEMSSTSIPLASLLSLYHIPQISFAASSRLLSKRDLYKSFFRTIPSDTNQISVMLDIIESFKWNYVFAIGSDDDYGKLGISELKQNAQGKNICVAHDEYIPEGGRADKKIDEIIEKLKEETNAKVVILFCYPRMGRKILEKAEKLGIHRIWLTSESFNPQAALDFPLDIKNQTVGILTVSLKRYRMPFLEKYMKDEMINNFRCNMWLQNFLETHFRCKPESLSADRAFFNGRGKGCPVSIDVVMSNLTEKIQGTHYNLVDAVSAVGHGIRNYLIKKCPGPNLPCKVINIPTKNLTNELHKVAFKNERGSEISFNENGDPRYAYYTVENIHFVNGMYEYKAVGDWDEERRNKPKLNLLKNVIQWPLWFTKPNKESHPSSRCSEDCKKGYRMVGKQECCWDCHPCEDGKFSDVENAMECKSCEKGYHTTDKQTCVKTQIKWLVIEDAPGMVIVVISCVGFLIIIVASATLIKLRILLDDTSPHLITLCCTLVLLTFVYGVLHILKPSQKLCQAVNALFYLFLMFYTAIVMIKTKFFTKYLMDYSKVWLRGSLLSAQLLSLFLFLLIEAASIVAWFHINPEQVKTKPITGGGVFEKRLQCQVDPTAARYVSTFIPIIILIIATFCAFRERNMEHSFYETKFLSFTCIALCIIIVAFMPTFHYVVGKYKSIVMAITMDLFGFTFMGCLIFPKVYVAVMRFKRNIGPMKSTNEASNAQENSSVNNSQVNAIQGEASITAFNNFQNEDNLHNKVGDVTSDKQIDATNFDEVEPRESKSGDANGHIDVVKDE